MTSLPVVVAISFVYIQSALCFIVTEKDEKGVWWFTDNTKAKFLSRGIDHVSYQGDYCPKLKYSPYKRTCEKKYNGNQSAWAEETTRRMEAWSFNTVAAWSDEIMEKQGLMYSKILSIGATAANWSHQFPDVFSPYFNTTAYNVSKTVCQQRKKDSNLIGYFTDNELHWPMHGTLLYYLLNLTTSDVGHQHAVSFLRSRYQGDLLAFQKAWNLTKTTTLPQHLTFDELLLSVDFSSLLKQQTEQITATDWYRDIVAYEETVSHRYFQVIHDAIKAYDPNHLILGCKFLNWPNIQGILSGAGHYVDVHSIDIYDYLPNAQRLSSLYNESKLPWLVAEFSFRANDSSLPNTKGAGPTVATQADRASHFDSYVKALVELPLVVGYHWFEWVDEPAEGRSDGENSNYGVVNITDYPYTILTSHMAKTNDMVNDLHAHGK